MPPNFRKQLNNRSGDYLYGASNDLMHGMTGIDQNYIIPSNE